VTRRLPWLLLLAACAKEAPPPATDSTPAAPVLQDSLVLTLPDSIPVWLTPGRTGTAADGASCREFGVRVGKKLVPLLFVREAPRFEAGVLRATLTRDCAPVATYRIDPVTAQPTKESGR
jgi:hypothetical protein